MKENIKANKLSDLAYNLKLMGLTKLAYEIQTVSLYNADSEVAQLYDVLKAAL